MDKQKRPTKHIEDLKLYLIIVYSTINLMLDNFKPLYKPLFCQTFFFQRSNRLLILCLNLVSCSLFMVK